MADPSIILYLRPIETLKPVQISNCASWLVYKGRFKDFKSARIWLHEQERDNIDNFKHIMSAYFQSIRPINYATVKRIPNVNKIRSTGNQYGDEYHMRY